MTTPVLRRHRPQRTAVLASAVLTLALAACGDSGDDSPTDPDRQPIAADGTNIDACLDGSCQIAVSGPTDIPIDGDVGVGVVAVTEIADGEVGVTCSWQTGDGQGTGSGGAISSIIPAQEGYMLPCNSLEIRVPAITDGTAIIEFSTG